MDGTESTPRRRGWIHFLAANRFVRRPVMFVGGIGLAVVTAAFTQPRWTDICTNINEERGLPCSPMTVGVMAGYLLIGLGLGTMILGPIVNSLYRLYRYGQAWETSRVETAVANVPLVVGIAYVVLGFAVAALAG